MDNKHEREAVQRVAQRIVKHGEQSGKRVSSREAERKAVEVARKSDAKRKR